jgi:hypothetical protein
MPALVQTIDGRYIRVADAETVGYAPGGTASYATALQPAAAPVVVQPAPVRTVYRTAPAAAQRVVVEEREAVQPKRSWAKTAMIIGGSSGAGAGVGGIVGGKKGALIGAAIGGGAASIYEATRRR